MAGRSPCFQSVQTLREVLRGALGRHGFGSALGAIKLLDLRAVRLAAVPMSAQALSEFLATAYPRTLSLEKCRVDAALLLNWRLAVEGRAHPAGEIAIGLGTEAEVMAIISRARSLPVGGLHGVEFAPPPIDRVTVSLLSLIFARGRELIAQGREDSERRLLVAVGDLAECEREATRLRRVRAGRRSLDRRPP